MPAPVEVTSQRRANPRPTTAPNIHYRPDIDGLRAIAVLSVVLFHSFPGKLTGGFTGVDIFFVISGYLITRIVAKEVKAGRFSYLDFYARRIRRLFPALIVVFSTITIAGWFVLTDFFYTRLIDSVVASALFSANIFFLYNISYFSPYVLDRPLLHLWSLGVEEQFYLVWPILIGSMSLFFSRHRRVIIGSVLVASYALCLYYTFSDPAVAFYSPFTRFWELATGGIISLLPDVRRRTWINDGCAGVGLALLLLSVLFVSKSGPFPALGGLPAVAGAALLIRYAPGTIVGRLLSLRPMVGVGLVSYPLYLWHWPLLSFAYFIYDRDWPPVGVRLALLALALLLATLTYLLFEKRLRTGRALALVAAMALVTVGAVVLSFAAQRTERSIERNPRAALIGKYAELHQTGLKTYYRAECDVFSWDVIQVRGDIDKSCTARTAPHMAMLWGDSHAQALSYGLRKALPGDFGLAQVASSGCPPALPGATPGLFAAMSERGCDKSNALAWRAIERLRPTYLFIALSGGHDRIDWNTIAARARALGVQQVVLIGPLPQWLPSLPSRVAAMASSPPLYVKDGLDQSVLATDLVMKQRHYDGLVYLSLIDRLCDDRGCRANVGGTLTAVDYGHLSPPGSLLVGKLIVGAVLGRPATGQPTGSDQVPRAPRRENTD